MGGGGVCVVVGIGGGVNSLVADGQDGELSVGCAAWRWW